MTGTESNLLVALTELHEAVKAIPGGAKPDLQALFARLDQLTRELPRGTDPGLLHYLHKKSYEKARLFLLGQDAENQKGNCRHV